MMLTKDKLSDAMPYIKRAHRCLEMIEWLSSQRKLSTDKHIPPYFDSLVECVIKLQCLLVEDDRYTELVGKAIAEVSKGRELEYQVTMNKAGDILFAIDGLLPLKELKRNALISWREHHDD